MLCGQTGVLRTAEILEYPGRVTIEQKAHRGSTKREQLLSTYP